MILVLAMTVASCSTSTSGATTKSSWDELCESIDSITLEGHPSARILGSWNFDGVAYLSIQDPNNILREARLTAHNGDIQGLEYVEPGQIDVDSRFSVSGHKVETEFDYTGEGNGSMTLLGARRELIADLPEEFHGFAADGSVFATSSAAGTEVNIRTTESGNLVVGPVPGFFQKFSPSGSFVILEGMNGYEIRSTLGGENAYDFQIKTGEGSFPQAAQLAQLFSADDERFAVFEVSENFEGINVINTDDWEVEARIEIAFEVDKFAITGDGTRVIIFSTSGQMFVWNIQKEELVVVEGASAHATFPLGGQQLIWVEEAAGDQLISTCEFS